MKVSTPQIFYIDNIIQIINEYIIKDNNLLNCNKYLSKLKYFKLNILRESTRVQLKII